MFQYSRGTNTYDNCPDQRTANDFNEFCEAITKDKSTQKGEAYICAALKKGIHYDDPIKHQGANHWRLKNHALSRRFLALDLDRFESSEIFTKLCDYLKDTNCLIYTTASHTSDAPRARVIIELDRDISYAEGELLGDAAQKSIESAIGIDLITFDKSVYRATQPIFTPVTSSHILRHRGKALSVDETLNRYPSFTSADLENNLLIAKPSFSLPEGNFGQGMRNETMLSYVGHLRSQGITEHEILVLAKSINQERFTPPLDEDELLSICDRYANQSQSDLALGLPYSSMLSPAIDMQMGDLRISSTPPPKREYSFSNQVTAGTLCTIGGSGGVSKTMLTMQMAVASAIGQDMAGIQVAEGGSLLFLGEEDEHERDRRLGAICATLKADINLVSKRVKCFGSAGMDIRLTNKNTSNPQPTSLVEKVIQLSKEHAEKSKTPVRIIVFDHARLVLGGDPNDAQDVTQLTRVLTHIARETNASVFLLAHSPKNVIGKEGNEINAGDIAGSSAFVDNSRASFMMWTMRNKEAKDHHIPDHERQNYLRIENVKANYAKTGGGYWLKRTYLSDWETAILEKANIQSHSIFQSNSSTDLRIKIIDELRKKPGGITERKIRDMAGKDGVLKASESKVRIEIDKMLNEGLIEKRPPTTGERKSFRLAGQIREVLVVCAP